MKLVHTNITYTISLDKPSKDSLAGPIPILRAWMYPHSNWLSLTVGRNKEDIHLDLSDWELFKARIDELIKTSTQTVTFKDE